MVFGQIGVGVVKGGVAGGRSLRRIRWRGCNMHLHELELPLSTRRGEATQLLHLRRPAYFSTG
jgi:hypothetical protein